MRRFLSRIVVSLSVVALATPATIASAAGPDEAARAETARAAAPVAIVQPVIKGTLREATNRAVAVTAEQRAGQPGPQTGQRSKGVRYQMGGGGKGAMVMGLVMTVVGLGASVYMIKMMQDKSNEDQQ
jgi:hypothetical protein